MRYRNCELFLRRSLNPIFVSPQKEKIEPHLIHTGIPQELLNSIPNPTADEKAIVIVIKPWEYLTLSNIFTILLNLQRNYWVYRLGNGFARTDWKWFSGYLFAYISDLCAIAEDLVVAPLFLLLLLVKSLMSLLWEK